MTVDSIMASIKEEGIEMSPSSDDAWANRMDHPLGLTVSNKRFNFLEAVTAGRLWRVAYAVKLDESLGGGDKFLSSVTKRRAVSVAVKFQHKEVIEFLSQYNVYAECIKSHNAKKDETTVEIKESAQEMAKVKNNDPSLTSDELAKTQAFDNLTWSIMGTEKSRKANELILAVERGDEFLTSYIISNNDALPLNEKFISKKTGQRALEKALENGQDAIFITLTMQKFFEKYGMNDDALKSLSQQKHKTKLKELVEKKIININDTEQRILKSAAWRGDNFMCLYILKLGSDYDFAIRHAGETGLRTLKASLVEFKLQRDEKEKSERKLLEAEQKKLVKLEKKDVINLAPDNDKAPWSWEALNDNTIVQCENIAITNTELQTIFNFKARNVQTICTVNKNATPAVAISVQNFRDIEDDSVLYEAWQKLKGLDKNPVPFDGNDSFTVHKPKPDPKLNIEGN